MFMPPSPSEWIGYPLLGAIVLSLLVPLASTSLRLKYSGCETRGEIWAWEFALLLHLLPDLQAKTSLTLSSLMSRDRSKGAYLCYLFASHIR